MDNENIFKFLAIISPFISGAITYLLTQRAKKSEYLYQNRIPTFKEILPVLIKIKKYALGKIALSRAAEFSPYYDEEGSALTLRAELANIGDSNEVFLSKKSKQLLADVDAVIGLFCNAELSYHGHKAIDPTYDIDYTGLFQTVEKCINELYKEVGLPNK